MKVVIIFLGKEYSELCEWGKRRDGGRGGGGEGRRRRVGERES